MSIESDLKTMSIDECCRKHKLTFKQLIHHAKKNKVKSYSGKKYIYRRGDQYKIERVFIKNGKRKYFIGGVYDELNEAIRARDYFEEHGWTRENIQKLKQKSYFFK